jgi:hypothetical protein
MASVLRLAALAAVTLVLLPAGGSGSATGSGLYGTVRKGPVKPVCQQGVPCDAPLKVKLFFWRTTAPDAGAWVVRSDELGRYRIALPPGYYRVQSAVKIGTTKLPRPHTVHVRKGHWDKIDFSFDTGIR